MEKSLPQYAKIEQKFGVEPPVIHCPVCGKAALDQTGRDVDLCRHVVFIYLGAAGGFAFKSGAFEQRLNEDDEFEVSFETFPAYLDKWGYDSQLLALEVSYGGMGCGPVWYTDVFGFHLDPVPGAAEGIDPI